MTETQCAGTCAADDDLRVIVDSHARRLDGLEDDVDTLQSGPSATMAKLISVEAQGQERERDQAQGQRRFARNAVMVSSTFVHAPALSPAVQWSRHWQG